MSYKYRIALHAARLVESITTACCGSMRITKNIKIMKLALLRIGESNPVMYGRVKSLEKPTKPIRLLPICADP